MNGLRSISNRFEDSVAVGADLQVSGHSHAGQIFPFTLLTNQIYDQHWGKPARCVIGLWPMGAADSGWHDSRSRVN